MAITTRTSKNAAFAPPSQAVQGTSSSAPGPTHRPARPSRRTQQRVLAYGITVIVLLVSFGIVANVTWRTNEHLHVLFETVAMTVALAVGTVALMRYYSRQENAMLFTGAAFIGTALLDGYHAVVSSTLMSSVLPSWLDTLIPWSWLPSRLFLALFLLFSWKIWRRDADVGPQARLSARHVYMVTGVVVLASFAFFAVVPLPRTHFANTWFHRPQELIPAALFLATLVGYLQKGYWRRSVFEHWLVLSLIAGIAAQIMMSTSDQIFSPSFDSAHVLKITSYLLVLTGLFASTFRVFQRAEAQVAALATQADELKEARDTALRAVDARSQFLASVSHEIRTPMNAILGMTELTLSTELSVEQRTNLVTSRASVEALITIVNDLLDLSKIEAGRLDVDSTPFSLRDVVGNTVNALSLTASSKGIALDSAMDPTTPDAVVGDPGRVRQVLMNLIGNAIKFTSEGHVKLAIQPLSIGHGRITLQFDVSDTGIGIAEDKLESIFDPFTQAEVSTTRRYGGTGLGLTISSQLVELMGGNIWAESVLGTGTTIHFTTALSLDAEDKNASRRTFNVDQPSVVLISGVDANSDVVVEMLAQGGVHPVVVADETAALAAIHAEGGQASPPVLLVDNANESFELLRRVVRDKTLSELCTIALVSNGRRGDAAEYRHLGVSGYLAKPIFQTDLLDAVATAASNHWKKNGFITVHSLREHRPRLHILLVDDSSTNRELAKRLLEIRGHSIETAENGVEAFEQWQRGAFDAIVMDVQLPEMDGTDVAIAIRREESSGEHIPIVALTGFATTSDRDRCFEAGMDSYVSKPYRAEQLYAALEQPDTDRRNQTDPALDRKRTSEPIDYEEAVAATGGSAELLMEIVEIFLHEFPELMDTIDAGFAIDDLDPVERASHQLKSSLGMLGAHRAQDAARDLENRAHNGTVGSARDAWYELRSAMEPLEADLTAIVSNNAMSSDRGNS